MLRTRQLHSIALSIFFFVSTLAAGLPQGHPSSSKHIAGIVREPNGTPVVGARVSLEGDKPAREESLSDAEGKFFLSINDSGNLVLHVHKDGFSDVEQKLVVPLTGGNPPVIILARVTDARSAGTASPDSMQLSESGEFTVAGIKDWTAAGGHGSDVNLRASESLARDTRTLASESAGASDPEQERRLRAAAVQNPSNFEANHSLGAFCLRSRHFADAIPPLEKAHHVNPQDFSAAYDLAQAYEGVGRHTEAKTLVEQSLAFQDRAELRRLLGDINENLNDPLAAEREYERAVQLDPNEENYFAWGSELLVHRAVEAAVHVFTKARGAFPQSKRILAGLGAALYANGAYEEAAERVCQSSDLSPADPEPYLFLGRMEQASPRPLPCAEAKLARFANQRPDDPKANFFHSLAILKHAEEKDRNQKAEALLQKAVGLDPRFAEAQLQLGVLQFQRDDLADAKASYEKAVLADPNFPDPHFRLAQLYRRTGEMQKASLELQAFERLKQSDAARVEQRRREIRQFVVVLKNPASAQ